MSGGTQFWTSNPDNWLAPRGLFEGDLGLTDPTERVELRGLRNVLTLLNSSGDDLDVVLVWRCLVIPIEPDLAVLAVVWATLSIWTVMEVRSVDASCMRAQVVGHLLYSDFDPANSHQQGDFVTGQRNTLPRGSMYAVFRRGMAADHFGVGGHAGLDVGGYSGSYYGGGDGSQGDAGD
jgi:hypothetical protein